MDSSTQALLKLHGTPGLGRIALFKLRQHFGDFAAAAAASSKQLAAAGLSDRVIHALQAQNRPAFQQTLKTLEKLEVTLVSFWDENYPPQLRAIHDPPALLYLRGRLPANDCLAIVGSRRATTAALQLTRTIAADLAEHNICIVSGLARGVDSAAHRGALQVAGNTIAVLGCGIDRIYPPDNDRLYHQILGQNAIISEYPPGAPPLAGHFPGRNRIISGLSRGVLIVEAAENSGSLITADFALEQGRELFAIPGTPNNPNSRGTNRLLKEGAQLVTEVEDILSVLWPRALPRREHQKQESFAGQLAEPALSVFRQLETEPCHIDEICRKCGLTPMDVSAILLDLELRGGVQLLPGNHYIRGKI
jgi:DNA processing protein